MWLESLQEFMTSLRLYHLVVGGAVFSLVFSLWTICMLIVSVKRNARERALAQRLGDPTAALSGAKVIRLWHDGEESTLIVPGDGRARRMWKLFINFPSYAGWNVSSGMVLVQLAVGTLLAGFVAYVLTRAWIPVAALVVTIPCMFAMYVRHRIDKNQDRFDRQLAEAMQLLARSLRAGHPLSGAFRLAADEMGAPVNEIFERLCQEQSLGVDLAQSLRDVAEDSRSDDFRLFATSVITQLRSGGNLADMMDTLAGIVRERIRLGQRVRVVSAQTQLSKRILLALPLIMLVVLGILNPIHMEPLITTPLGNMMLFCGGVAMLLGWITMNRMARIHY